jgi:thiamine biosynthesis protein ThiS
MAEGVTVVLNGNARTLSDLGEQPRLDELVSHLGFRADRVAIERNGEIVPRLEWPNTPLADGDRLELVHFVGGGTA